MKNSLRPLLKRSIYKSYRKKPNLTVHSSYASLITRLQMTKFDHTRTGQFRTHEPRFHANSIFVVLIINIKETTEFNFHAWFRERFRVALPKLGNLAKVCVISIIRKALQFGALYRWIGKYYSLFFSCKEKISCDFARICNDSMHVVFFNFNCEDKMNNWSYTGRNCKNP